MTAEQVAERMRSRRIGPGRWLALCPAHPDRHPSLSIKQGNRGVLLKCWSRNCSIQAIAAALKLPVAAFCDGRRLTTAQKEAADRKREAVEAAERATKQRERRWRGSAEETAEALRRAIRELSGRLMMLPDDSEAVTMTRTLHDLLGELHGYDRILDTTRQQGPELGSGPER